MKKFLIAGLIVASLVTSAFASTNAKVSSKAEAHLGANYSAAKNISWTVNDNFEKASFTMGTEKIDVYYDGYGDLLGSSKTMALDKLPKAALDILTTTYTFPDYQLTDCIECTDAYDNKNYYVSFYLDSERVIVSISTNGRVTRM